MERRRGRPKGPGKPARQCEIAWLNAPHATAEEIMQATRASRPTVMKVRAGLVRSGRIPPPPNSQLVDIEIPVSPDTLLERQEKLKIIKDKSRYSLQDMEMVLTEILKGTTQARDAAVLARVIGVLKSQMGEKREVGPGVPLKDFQRVQRLSLLMRACEKQEVLDAWQQAYPGEAPLAAPSPVRSVEDEAGRDALPSLVGEAPVEPA